MAVEQVRRVGTTPEHGAVIDRHLLLSHPFVAPVIYTSPVGAYEAVEAMRNRERASRRRPVAAAQSLKKPRFRDVNGVVVRKTNLVVQYSVNGRCAGVALRMRL